MSYGFGEMNDKWMVKVIKLDEPENVGGLETIHVNGKTKFYQLRMDTELTNQLIQVLEDAGVHTEIPISPGSPMWMNKEAAQRMNPDMSYIERDGRCWLERYTPRFSVQRLHPVQEKIVIPAGAVTAKRGGRNKSNEEITA